MFNNFSPYFIVFFASTVAAIPDTPAFADEHPICPQLSLSTTTMMTADMAASSLHSFAINDVNTTLLTLDFNGASLDSKFLAALIREFGKLTKFPGLRVVNANFPEGVNLDFADINIPLEVSGGCSNAPWTLEHAHFKDGFAIRDATMKEFRGYRSRFEEDLAITQVYVNGNVDLKNVEVGKTLDLSGIRAWDISVDALHASGNVTINSLKGHPVQANTLSIAKANVEGDLYITGASNFWHVSLEHSNFSGSATFSSIHVLDSITLADTRFGHDVVFGVNINDGGTRRSVFYGPVDIEGAVVGGYVNLDGTSLNLVDLGGSVATRGLILATKKDAIIWRPGYHGPECKGRAQLNLQDFETSTIQDYDIGSWPTFVEMDNFRFTHTRAADGGSNGLLTRFKDVTPWLNRDCSFNPVSYERVAELLRADGHWDVANEVLTARWQTDLDQDDTPWLRKTLLFLAKWMIGFGVGMGYLLLLFWASLLTLIGWFVITRPGAYTTVSPDGPKLGILYSLNRLLPVISLADNNSDVILTTSLARSYFAVHTILGWIMSAFIVAGLALLSR